MVKPNKASTAFGFEATTSIGLLLAAVLLLPLLLVVLALDEVLASDMPVVVLDLDAVVVRPAVVRADPHPVAATAAADGFFTLLVVDEAVLEAREEGFFLVGEPRLA